MTQSQMVNEERAAVEASLDTPTSAQSPFTSEPDARGRFGQFGGKYAPETVMGALDELEAAYDAARQDPAFLAEFSRLEAEYVGRPTPLYHAAALSKRIGGAQIYLK